MTESSSFTSLMALVDSHLSKTGVQESRSDFIPTVNGPPGGTVSDSKLSFTSSHWLPKPSFNLSESPIQNVLAEQVANMLKAKELKKQQDKEQQRLTEEMKKIKLKEDEDCVIDLMHALRTPCGPALPIKEEVLSSSSSFESLFEPKFIDCDETPEQIKSPEPLLPCITDMTYILKQKTKRGKCSTFGKVLSARMRPVAAPYLREDIATTVVPFDFKTASPCDLIKEKLRKPTSYSSYQPDIINFVV